MRSAVSDNLGRSRILGERHYTKQKHNDRYKPVRRFFRPGRRLFGDRGQRRDPCR